MSDVVLELRRIHKSYNAGAPNELSVLEDVNVVLKRGQISALVAPSGAGKSTLLHIAGLLDTPDQGDVIYMDLRLVLRVTDSAPLPGVKTLDLYTSSIIYCPNSVRWKILLYPNWPMARILLPPKNVQAICWTWLG